MALTVEQAKQAGLIAAGINGLEEAITAAQRAVDGNASLSTVGASGTLVSDDPGRVPDGIVLNANIPLTVEESATILNALIAIYEARLAVLQAQLAELTA